MIALNLVISIKYPKLNKIESSNENTFNIPLDSKFFDAKIRTPQSAKENKKFWAEYGASGGAALRVLETPSLFSIIFPGYPESMRSDKELWDRYFDYSFAPTSYFLDLPSPLNTIETRVIYSWNGCLDIFEKYGADVLVLGNSEVYQGLIPNMLNKTLKDILEIENPRILFCVTTAMPLKALARSLRYLKKSKNRVKIAIFGFSFWTANTEGKINFKYEAEKEVELQEYENKKLTPWKEKRFTQYFPKITWDYIVPASLQKIKEYKHVSAVASTVSVPSNTDLDENTFLDEAKLQKVEASIEPDYDATRDMTDSDCNISKAKKQLETITQLLSETSDNVFIYLTPALPFHTQSAPQCFRPEVKRVLHSLRASNIFIKTDEMASYGLLFKDYTKPSQQNNMRKWDQNHTNFDGAKKTTLTISNWITSELLLKKQK